MPPLGFDVAGAEQEFPAPQDRVDAAQLAGPCTEQLCDV